MIEFLDGLDRELLLLLNFDGGFVLDEFWYWFSAKWTWVPLYMAILACMAWRDYSSLGMESRDGNLSWLCLFVWQVVCVTLVITLADQVASHLIKPIVCRVRPAQDVTLIDFVHIVRGDRGYKFGFVSSHAANTWALMLFMAYVFKKRWVNWTMASWALLTCYSRIYLGVHYPGDVFCGAIVGLAAAFVVMRGLYVPVVRRMGWC